MRNRNEPFVRARRAFAMVGVLGLIITVVSMFMTATQLRGQEEGAAEVGLLGVTLFFAERATEGAASTATLRPGIGVLLVLVIIPAIAATLVYFGSRRKAVRLATEG